jgi:hypothetical protein
VFNMSARGVPVLAKPLAARGQIRPALVACVTRAPFDTAEQRSGREN